MIEEAIIAANNWSHYEADEAWELEYDKLLTDKYNSFFRDCRGREVTLDEIHKLRVFADHLPHGLLRLLGELHKNFNLS